MTPVPPPITIDGIGARIAAAHQRLLDPAGLSVLLGEPFVPMLLGAYEHYEEHAEELEAHHW